MVQKSLILAALVAVLVPSLAAAVPAASFDAVLTPYEAVRVALVADDLAAVRAPAGELKQAVAHLGHHLTAEAAGVPAAKLADVRALVPQLEKATGALAAAGNLDQARDAFGDLSKALVAWREAAGEGPAVAYCSMAKRSWLQPADAAIGNPYYGAVMARCGNLVTK